MTAASFAQILLLLGTTALVVAVFQWLRVPSSLAYLVVGVLLGPHTGGPVIENPEIHGAAEFGIVFLMFTIGLNLSLPQVHALRHLVLGLGTGQVVLTTLVVGAAAFAFGLSPEAAFVVGAVFAQSSTAIIGKQLAEQGEEYSRHGRLAVAMSVFQDVTAVPLIVVVPVLAVPSFRVLGESLAWALAKAVLAFVLVFFAGRWLLRPLFHAVASRRSAELFTLTVLLVSLGAGGLTHQLGLSVAFGAFLVGMMLGETEFRHQVESTIRPFRDVLLGLFFVSIGMLFDPSLMEGTWQWALGGAFVLLAAKTVLVAVLVRATGIDLATAWRVGLLVAVGGEFGFALLAIALDAGVISQLTGQIVLMAVLLSMITAPFLIRYNRVLVEGWFRPPPGGEGALSAGPGVAGSPHDHVIICGYGRIGQNIGRFLEEERIPYVALDLDPQRVKEARIACEPVYYGDSSERDMLEAVGIGKARLVVVSHEDLAAAHKVLHHAAALRPGLPVMVRTRDESHVEELRRAGAAEVVPETLEAGLMIASQALLLLNVPLSRVARRIREQRLNRYLLLREFFRGDETFSDDVQSQDGDRLRAVPLPPGCRVAGCTLAELALENVVVTALVRHGVRELAPAPETRLAEGDAVVLFGAVSDLDKAERRLLG
ncbi:cation:proton antiporter [Methylococcus capsulatus]|uniref:cation:proton antiporter domain-containing protein n=1 Tax=Methylococcus capsulatus TaxID=414 RepID=UPI002FD9D86F